MVSVIDAHLHVVSADTDRFPQQPGGFGRDWWTGPDVGVEQIGATSTPPVSTGR